MRQSLYQYLTTQFSDQNFESVLDLSQFPKEFKKIYISISHCKDLGVFIVSSRPVGIDIEITSRLKKEVVERVSSSGEMLMLEKVGLLWPAKEALFKCEANLKLLSEIKLDSWKKSQNNTHEFLSSNRIGWVQSFKSHTIAIATKNN